MMGKLHIEMAALEVPGKWLGNSVWTAALVQGGITTTGKADTLLTDCYAARTRYPRQVTAGALYNLPSNAYATNTPSEHVDHEHQDFKHGAVNNQSYIYNSRSSAQL